MRVLILGNSAISRNRLLPALDAMPVIDGVEIASRSDPNARFSDYETALSESSSELVYVSLVNSEHAYWTERALQRGRHVIVDKPAFLNLEQAERLVELSRSQGLCLAEAIVYTRHPQIDMMRSQFERPEAASSCIFASFSFPPLEESNFRYRKALGGGALYDLGPYAVSAGRLFWKERPEEVVCQILESGGPDSVDTSFSVLMRYPQGRSLLGHFGFTTAYRNRLSVIGPDRCVEMDRSFTTPATMENELRISQQTGSSSVKTPAVDTFALFLKEVIDRIRARDLEDLRNELLENAFVLDWMQRSAKGD